MSDIIIKAIDLTKIYKIRRFLKTEKVLALDRLNLEVKKGNIYGFLGPNGAGKTTTIKLILGLTPQTAGEVFVLGKDPRDVATKAKIGYLPEIAYYEKYLRIDEILSYYAGLYKMDSKYAKERIDYVLEIVGLSLFRKRFLHEYSKGMLQRVGLAQALLNDPDLLILDEPTSGLDPIAQIEIRDIIKDLAVEGKTIFLSSHFLSEVELICTHVGILKNAKLIKWGPMGDLLKINKFFEIHIEPNKKFENEIAGYDVSKIRVEDKLIVSTEQTEFKDKVLSIAIKTKARILAVYPRQDSLETLFKKLMKGNEDVHTN